MAREYLGKIMLFNLTLRKTQNTIRKINVKYQKAWLLGACFKSKHSGMWNRRILYSKAARTK